MINRSWISMFMIDIFPELVVVKYIVHTICGHPVMCLVPLSVRITAISLPQMFLPFDTDQ
jgi:hypothetical protein